MQYQIWRCVHCLLLRVWGMGDPDSKTATVYLTCEKCSDAKVMLDRRVILLHTPHTFIKNVWLGKPAEFINTPLASASRKERANAHSR